MHDTAPTEATARAIRPRVVFCNWRDTRHPEGGGSERYLDNIARALARDGFEVTVLTARYPGSRAKEQVDGVRYLRAGSKLGVYLATPARLVRLRLPRGTVVVDVQNGLPFFARLFTRAHVMVLVHHVHREQWPVVYGPLMSRVGWAIESRLAPLAFRGCQYVTVSRVTRTELVSLGVDPAAVAVVHNGVNSPLVKAHRSATPRLCVLGRLVPHKQIEHVVEAVATLREQMPEIHLDVIGDGWWRDQLTARVAELDLGRHVTLHGFVTEERKEQLLCASWVNAVPSLKEGWGLTVVEAAAHGVPSVAYRSAGGVAESVVDGRTGLLANDTEEFVEHVRLLLTDERRRGELGEAARERALTFSWAASAESFQRVLADVRRGRRTSAEDPAEPQDAHEVGPDRGPGESARSQSAAAVDDQGLGDRLDLRGGAGLNDPEHRDHTEDQTRENRDDDTRNRAHGSPLC